MEILDIKIKKFLTIDGLGYGLSSGFSDGSGFGDGSGSGNGDGDGSGYGCGDGSGYGCGNGSGYGEGYGSGNGYGNSCGLTSFNRKKICYIDSIATIIDSIHHNVAKGKILMNDFTMQKCYIAKGQNKFAHGETIKKATQALQEKILEGLDTEQAIEEFKKHFSDINKKYNASEFFVWHHILTGSCEMGRLGLGKKRLPKLMHYIENNITSFVSGHLTIEDIPTIQEELRSVGCEFKI